MDQIHPASAQPNLANSAAQAPLFEAVWWPAMRAWLKERCGPLLPVKVIDPAHGLGDALGDYGVVCDAD